MAIHSALAKLIHVAGISDHDRVQRCILCGHVLARGIDIEPTTQVLEWLDGPLIIDYNVASPRQGRGASGGLQGV